MTAFSSDGVNVGLACRIRAHAPARCGVAIEVPVFVIYVPFNAVEVITNPGPVISGLISPGGNS